MRVLLATDRPSLGAALSLYLTGRHIEVVGVVGHAADVCVAAVATQADVVLVDRHLGDAAVAETIADLKDDAGSRPVIVLDSSQDSGRAGVSGADRLATVGDPPDALLALIREVAPAVP